MLRRDNEDIVKRVTATEGAIRELGIRVVLFTPPGHESRIGSFFNGSFACDDVQATYRQLKARGVEFTSPPAKQPRGEYATFKDPDGNQFVLSSS